MTPEAPMPYLAMSFFTSHASFWISAALKSSPADTTSMPIARQFIAQFPACQAVSPSATLW